MIPGLEQAEFVRFGMVHRNTYINGPTVLAETWQTRTNPALFFAGQISGVEGYVESAASGLIAGRNAAALVRGEELHVPPRTTAIGALAFYVSHANPHDYQPTNITFGIMEPPPTHIRDKQKRKLAIADRALEELARWNRDIRSADLQVGRFGLRRMKDTLKDFLQHLRRRDVSPHTLAAYENDVATFLQHTAHIRQKHVEALSAADVDAFAIRAFLGELHRQRISASSSARKLSAIRTFVKFLRREDLIEDDPAALVASPKKPETIPAHLTVGEMNRLLEMPDASTPLGRRDRAILELFYASGLRLSELVGLDMEDVNLSGRMVRVMGKGRKERLVPFNSATADALRAWLKDRNASGQRAEGRGQTKRARAASAAAVPQLSRRTVVGPQRRSSRAPLRRRVRREVRHQPARAATFVRDPSARERRRSASHSRAAGSCASEHDSTLYPRQRATVDRRL